MTVQRNTYATVCKEVKRSRPIHIIFCALNRNCFTVHSIEIRHIQSIGLHRQEIQRTNFVRSIFYFNIPIPSRARPNKSTFRNYVFRCIRFAYIFTAYRNYIARIHCAESKIHTVSSTLHFHRSYFIVYFKAVRCCKR